MYKYFNPADWPADPVSGSEGLLEGGNIQRFDPLHSLDLPLNVSSPHELLVHVEEELVTPRDSIPDESTTDKIITYLYSNADIGN